MSKWKCEICGKEFENFHAQGFDDKIHCPLCYFKRENKNLQQRIDKSIEFIKENTIEESNGCGYKWEMIHNDYLTNNINQLLEILKGDSND